MTKRVRLTKAQEAEIQILGHMAERCQAWIERNGVKVIESDHNLSKGSAVEIAAGRKPKGRTDAEIATIRRKYRAVRRVTKLWSKCSKQVIKERYGISGDRIDTILGHTRVRKPNFAHRFLTMRLTSRPAEGFYYGFA